ncbi:MAG: cupin domain-containing protein [Pseudomonadota bacterium]
MRTRYEDINSFISKDGSRIRELMHPDSHDVKNQSFAEATVPPGTKTELHLHKTTEELYIIFSGFGDMTMGEDTFRVNPGDTICIPPNTPHCIFNPGDDELRFFCACSPAYSHQDTVLL